MKLPRLTYLYCLYSFSHLFRFKVGISNDVRRRCAEIEMSIKGETGQTVKVRPLLYVPLFFAYNREQWIHKKLDWCRDKNMIGSGFTEWFWWCNIFAMCAVYAVCRWYICPYFGTDIRPSQVLWLLAIPLPLDFAILILMVFLVESAAVMGGITLILYLISLFI